ncbi:conserved hypothetical protein, partial [Ricinus communis]
MEPSEEGAYLHWLIFNHLLDAGTSDFDKLLHSERLWKIASRINCIKYTIS